MTNYYTKGTLSDVAVLVGIGALLFAFSPAQGLETQPGASVVTLPASQAIDPNTITFTIDVPKISAHAVVIPQVDTSNPEVYERALAMGVAQAKGTAYPGQSGNIFLFAHSAANSQIALRYNAVFYELYKLVPGDEVILTHGSERFIYRVTDKKIVSPTEVSYLTNQTAGRLLTLMTCYPPGSLDKRLLLFANLVETDQVTAD